MRMAERLEPCPFCGGEAMIEEVSETIGDRIIKAYIVKCSKCWCAPKPNNYDGNKQNVIDRWNSRYTNTCKMTRDESSGPDEAYPIFYFTCSECRESVMEGSMFSYRYCPNCGAEVVDD